MSDEEHSTIGNGESRGGRRRRRRQNKLNGGTPATPRVETDDPAEPAEWVDRVDALAGELASLRTRGAILDHVVREMMKVLPAESVIVHTDEPPLLVEPRRTVIPLATAGRRFGAVEIALKADRQPQPAERALGIALIRQAALALERVELEDAAWPALPDPAPQVLPPAADPATLARELDHLAAEVRQLAALARSAALPPAQRVNEAERTAAATIASLRARLLPADQNNQS